MLLDPAALLLNGEFVAGGSPWRLLRLPGISRSVAEQWREGGRVGAGEGRFARTLVQQGILHPVFSGDVDLDEVDVVIPTHDDAGSLRKLLIQLQGLHVTVVDDASHDEDLTRAVANDFDVSLVRLDVNSGPGAARNAGARSSQRPFLCFIDTDVSIDNAKDVLVRLMRQFDDPLLGACAPRIRGGGGDSLRARFERRFGPLDLGERSGLVVPGGPVGYVPSALLMVRRDAFGDGFKEELRTGEDVDLVWRLHDHGWLVRYNAEVIVVHNTRKTWSSWVSQRFGYGVSSAKLAKLHGNRLAPLRSDPWTLIAWTFVFLKRPMIGLRIVRAAREHLQSRIAETDDSSVARKVVAQSMLKAGGPLSRALVRTFGPLVLVSALHPRLRRRALFLYAVGTAWRWRNKRVVLSDVPLGVADDLVYAAGVMKGAWQEKTLVALKPHVTKSSMTVRDVLGLARAHQ